MRGFSTALLLAFLLGGAAGAEVTRDEGVSLLADAQRRSGDSARPAHELDWQFLQILNHSGDIPLASWEGVALRRASDVAMRIMAAGAALGAAPGDLCRDRL